MKETHPPAIAISTKELQVLLLVIKQNKPMLRSHITKAYVRFNKTPFKDAGTEAVAVLIKKKLLQQSGFDHGDVMEARCLKTFTVSPYGHYCIEMHFKDLYLISGGRAMGYMKQAIENHITNLTLIATPKEELCYV